MVQDNHILEKDTSPNLEVARETPKEAKPQDLVSKNPSWPEFEVEKTIREQEARESLPRIESSEDVEKISEAEERTAQQVCEKVAAICTDKSLQSTC